MHWTESIEFNIELRDLVIQIVEYKNAEDVKGARDQIKSFILNKDKETFKAGWSARLIHQKDRDPETAWERYVNNYERKYNE